MPKYKFSVPQARGLDDPNEFKAQASGGLTGFGDVDPNIRDVIIHAAICRIAFADDTNHEFHTVYDEETNILDIDIPDDELNDLTRITLGPKIEKYFSWLTNSLVNLRRDTMQFTIGSEVNIAAGQQGIGLTVGYDCLIERVDCFLGGTGSISTDLWAVPAEQYPGNSGFALGNVAVAAAVSNVDADITTWDKELERGDVLIYDIQSAAAQLATITLYVCRYSIFDS